MRYSNNKYPIYENVEIIDLAIEGKAVAKIKNKNNETGELTVFVNQVVPGDIVDIQVIKRKKNYREAKPIRFIKYSEKRIEPFCRHFNECGGCTRQNLSYADQLFYKHRQVAETMKRIGKVTDAEILPILGAGDLTFYRNKLEYTFSNKRWLTESEKNNEFTPAENALGYHIPGRFDKVINISECFLQPPPSNEIRNEVRKFCIENNFDFFDLKQQTGFLRNLIIRTPATGEVMVIFSFFKENTEQREMLLNYISLKFPQITSLMYVINTKSNDTILDLEIILFKGKSYFYEEMEGLKFKVGPKSFYQTNSKQAYSLYKKVREFSEFKGTEIVYDLYTGTGTIANFIARNVKKVIGLEYVTEAVEDAKINSEINGITNTEFFAGDMKDILTKEFTTEKGNPDIIILDPPRAGLHPKVAETVLAVAPEKIIYVSCNPATQARDIQIFGEKYKTVKFQPVDMFPHTHHVENISLLRRID
jgi:23S rRNA (uracil1939-C5)-methyltransferase